MTAEIETGRLRPPPVATAASRPPPPVRETLSAVGHAEPVRRRRFLSPLTRRILLLNALAIAIPVVGLLYLDAYRNSLIESELKSLRIEGELFAGALGSSGVTGDLGEEELGPEFTRKTVRRLVEASKNRARVFLPDGSLTADSYRLMGPGGQVQIEILPPIQTSDKLGRLATDVYDWVVGLLPPGRKLPVYHEAADQRASDYPEVAEALTGEVAEQVRDDGDGGLVLTVAVPVQRYRQVLGALLLSADGDTIDQAVRTIRLDVLKVFAIALTVTTLLSFYLAGTIVRPIVKLAEAADRVRRGHRRQTTIPDFSRRGDEIGNLSGSLRDMTDALWQRMDAIERFAADVAHEIKNPLTSLRSAVETVARIDDPGQQRRLMGIILDDVQRLDRLISDISNASRLDAELSRAEIEPVDLGELLSALADSYGATAAPDSPRLELDIAEHHHLVVTGIGARLAQVFRNLIDNALSFSPPNGEIRIKVRRDGDIIRTIVSDQGPGIPSDKVTAIFDRFYSERPAGEKFGTHSGLGLSISKQIVEAHGGQIVASNRTDDDGGIAGARFTVTLPRA
jgi:two-component system, OmpR family, sensor histidine kinase ChvG